MTPSEIRSAMVAHAAACREALMVMRPRPDLSEELRANLAGAYFARANLAGAYFARANLAGAYLVGANLAGAYLVGANLAGANLGDAKGIRDALSIGPIGSRRAHLTAIQADDGTVTLSTGCFRGTLGDFLAAVDRQHGLTDHGRAYRAAMDLIRVRFGIASEVLP